MAIVERRALNSSFYNIGCLERTIKLSSRGAKLVDVFNLLRKYEVPAEKVQSVSRGHPGDDSYMVEVTDLDVIETLKGQCPLTYRNRTFHLISLGKQSVTIKLHWLPLYINDSAIKSFMAEFGTVLNIRRLTSQNEDSGRTFQNGTREIILEVSELERKKIPHIIKFEDGMAVLLTIQGRPPLCLRCSQVGHLRKSCIYGTRSNRTYSGVARAAVIQTDDDPGSQLDFPIVPTITADVGNTQDGAESASATVTPQIEEAMDLITVEKEAPTEISEEGMEEDTRG